MNPLHCADFYKTGHRQQYPKGTELVVSNLTPRSGKHSNAGQKEGVVFFGLQYFIYDFLIEQFTKNFFLKDKQDIVLEYKRRMDTSLGKDAVPVDHVVALYDLGYLPIEIKAVYEGTFVPVGVPCLTIHNTKPEFFWLTNYLETILSAYLWLPCTSATTARGYRKLLEKYALKTGSSVDFVDFQAHDFSFRGMSSLQSALVSGAAHLIFFKGTDTVPAIDFLEKYYFADTGINAELIGGSVPATEHSVMCMGGEDDELGTFKRLITETYPKGIVSIVSDTWDFWKVISEYSKTLYPDIMKREGKVVFRPDSGNPADIICGDQSFGYNAPDEDCWTIHDKESPQYKGAVEVLWDIFGGTITSTGHKLLDPHVGLIYGDSINYKLAEEILERLEKKGFASSNIVFGVGSYTYQYVTRDTWGWAVKATYGVVNGDPRNIFKKPKTDTGEKNSAKGLVAVKRVGDKLTLEQGVTWDYFNSDENMLQTVFRNGNITRKMALAGVRHMAKHGPHEIF